MADINKIKVDGVEYDVEDAVARVAIGDLSALRTNAKTLVGAINELLGPTIRISSVTLLSASWVENSENLYSQVVSIYGVTENSQVDLTPSSEQLKIFHDKSLAMVAENDGGVVTVYAIGQKPENDYVMQVTITEVSE